MRKTKTASQNQPRSAKVDSGKLAHENALLRAEISRLRVAMTVQQKEIETLQAHAVQDALLPVLNRRGFVAEIARAFSFCARYRMPATLIYCDLDNFKMINDTHGHEAGDRVLMHAVMVLQSGIRRSDILGRLGGDEFAILLWNANAELGHAKAEELKLLIGESVCETPAGPLRMSLSCGVAQLRPEELPEQLVARADAAMYEDKRARRASLVAV
ncbi:MAG: GGDEF domain-containing protein [Pseudomonadota bacterium]